MIVRETTIDGVLLLEGEVGSDDRGSFARVLDRHELRAAGGDDIDITSLAVSRNRRSGTLRGLHHQRHPHGEAKVVWCSAGRCFDVAVDLRPASPTYRAWFGVELAGDDHLAVLIPVGCSHGFLTLEDETDVSYALSGAYRPDQGAGIRWDDPGLGIAWPAAPKVIAERDATLPDVDWDHPEELL